MNNYKLAWFIMFIILSLGSYVYLFDKMFNEAQRNKINGFKLAWEIVFLILCVVSAIYFYMKILDELSLLPNLINFVCTK